MTHAEWETKGRALFGADMEKWRFVCPSCGHVISMEQARTDFAEMKGCGWSPGQECLGRYSPRVVRADGTRCDWAAYGLFRGPVIIHMPNGAQVGAFEFAAPPAPLPVEAEGF